MVILSLFSILAACSEDDGKITPNMARSSNTSKTNEMLAQLKQIKPGAGSECLNLEYTHLKCAFGDKANLNNSSTSKIDAIQPIELLKNQEGKQSYKLKGDDLSPVSMESLTESIKSGADNPQYALIEYIKSAIYNFSTFISNGEIKADGTVQNYNLPQEVLGQSIPIQYVVDCNGKTMTIHYVVGDYGYKETISLEENGIYEFESQSMTSDKKNVEAQKGYCIPVSAQDFANSLQNNPAVQNSVPGN